MSWFKKELTPQELEVFCAQEEKKLLKLVDTCNNFDNMYVYDKLKVVAELEMELRNSKILQFTFKEPQLRVIQEVYKKLYTLLCTKQGTHNNSYLELLEEYAVHAKANVTEIREYEKDICELIDKDNALYNMNLGRNVPLKMTSFRSAAASERSLFKKLIYVAVLGVMFAGLFSTTAYGQDKKSESAKDSQRMEKIIPIEDPPTHIIYVPITRSADRQKILEGVDRVEKDKKPGQVYLYCVGMGQNTELVRDVSRVQSLVTQETESPLNIIQDFEKIVKLEKNPKYKVYAIISGDDYDQFKRDWEGIRSDKREAQQQGRTSAAQEFEQIEKVFQKVDWIVR